MGMYVIEEGTDCVVENIHTQEKRQHITTKTNVFWKEELKWSQDGKLCFQHFEREGGHPNWRIIVDADVVKYG